MKKRLLNLFLMVVCVSFEAFADITITDVTIDSKTGYAITGYGDTWEPGSLNALLSGEYTGNVYYQGTAQTGENLSSLIGNITAAEAIRIGGDANELLNVEDLNSISNLTNVKYIDMEQAKFAEGAAAGNIFSNVAEYIALPYDTSIEDMIAMSVNSPNLRAAAATDEATHTEFTGYSFKQAGEIWNICQLNMIDGILTDSHLDDSGNTLTKLTLGGELDDTDASTIAENINYPFKNANSKSKYIYGCIEPCAEEYVAPSHTDAAINQGRGYSPWARDTQIEIDFRYAQFANIGDLAVVSNHMTKLSLPEGDWLTEIPAYMFANFYDVTEWIIPNNIVNIHDAAFSNNSDVSKLAHIAIGNGIKVIGHCAFSQNKNKLITTLDFADGISDVVLLSGAFEECRGIKHLVLPYGIKSLGEKCFYMLEGLESVYFPSTLEYIGKYCFHQTGLTTLTIPASVKVIDLGAFGRCAIKDIYLMAKTLDELPYIYGLSYETLGNAYDESSFGSNSISANNSSPITEGWPNPTMQHYATLSVEEADDAYRWSIAQGNTVACLHYDEALRDFIDYNPYFVEGEQTLKPKGNAIVSDPNDYYEQKYLTDTYYYVDNDGKTHPVCNAGDYYRCNYASFYNSETGQPFNPGDGHEIVPGYSSYCQNSTMPSGAYYNPETGVFDDTFNFSTTVDGETYLFKVLTKEAWRQFVFKRGDAHHDDVVLKKEFDNIWYTMCYPFGLTDEQLEAAFNAKYNIADFSGVEVDRQTKKRWVKELDELGNEVLDDNGKPKMVEESYYNYDLILHFNTIAKAKYFDTDYNEYTRVEGTQHSATNGQSLPYTTYDYKDANGDTYENIEGVFTNIAFAKGGNKENGIVYINGYLAWPGHPYLIHPNIGTSEGDPSQTCYLAGLEFFPLGKTQLTDQGQLVDVETWDELCRINARTVDLRTGKGYTGDVIDDANETDYNFVQKAYETDYPEIFAGHPDQTYTFIGNVTTYDGEEPTVANGGLQDYNEAPSIENGQLETYPDVTLYTDLYPNGPTMAVQGPAPESPVDRVGERMTEEDRPNAPEDVTDPSLNTEKYSASFQTFYNTQRTGWTGYYWGEKMANDEVSFADVADSWDNNVTYRTKWDCKAFNQYYGYGDDEGIPSGVFDFESLKTLCKEFKAELTAFQAYGQALADYYTALNNYQANVEAWAEYDREYEIWNSFDPIQAQTEYEQALQVYNEAVRDWEAEKGNVDTRNAAVLTAYQEACSNIDTQNNTTLTQWKTEHLKAIPLNSYFLSRRKTEYYTHFFRNTTTSKKNPWNQYTAIVNPSDNALNGIETIIGGVITEEGSAKGFNFVIDKPFSPYTNSTDEQQNTDAIEKIVEEAIAKGEKVQHMNVVYSIDGKVMGRDMQSLSGLPTGLYIINGKKYFVK